MAVKERPSRAIVAVTCTTCFSETPMTIPQADLAVAPNGDYTCEDCPPRPPRPVNIRKPKPQSHAKKQSAPLRPRLTEEQRRCCMYKYPSLPDAFTRCADCTVE